MKINLSDLLYAFSYGLDCVEKQLMNVTTNHGKRVAWLSVLLGRTMGLDKEELLNLTACAVLHDNAVAEYMKEETELGAGPDNQKKQKMGVEHCISGEENMKQLPFYKGYGETILYHHEEADGSGYFGKKEEEIPLFAQIIHMSDVIDVLFRLKDITEEKYEKIKDYVEKKEAIRFSSRCVKAFQDGVRWEELRLLDEEDIAGLLKKEADSGFREYSNEEIHAISDFFARIIDYKSNFTRKHSMGMAVKAEAMGKYYGWDEDKCTRMYLTGAVHDLGKLAVDNDILEKPDKLTEKEFKKMKNHAYLSWWLLNQVRGFEEITKWAAYHHEKLDGTGYPFGLTGAELSFEEKLVACLDIFQALTEPRPYKDGFSYEKTMAIMRDMVEKGAIDGEITEDVGKAFCH